jgi:hypothetical protein
MHLRQGILQPATVQVACSDVRLSQQRNSMYSGLHACLQCNRRLASLQDGLLFYFYLVWLPRAIQCKLCCIQEESKALLQLDARRYGRRWRALAQGHYWCHGGRCCIHSRLCHRLGGGSKGPLDRSVSMSSYTSHWPHLFLYAFLPFFALAYSLPFVTHSTLPKDFISYYHNRILSEKNPADIFLRHDKV